MEQKIEKKGQEHGAVIIEASIVLPIFMFFMFTLLSLIQIAYTQARVAIALDSVNKQVAEYAHVYFATGMNEVLSGSGGKSSAIANDVAEFLKELGGSDVASGEIGELLNEFGNAIEGDSIAGLIKHEVGSTLINKMLNSALGDDYRHKNRIQGDFDVAQCKVLENGADLFLQVKYDIKPLQLIKTDYVFHMSCCSYTQAWSGE